MKRNLTDRYIQTIKPESGKTRATVFDTRTPGLCVRVTDKGHRSFYVMTRGPAGKQKWALVLDGFAPVTTLAKARELAPEAVARLKSGKEAFPKPEHDTIPENFEAVAKNFIRRHVDKQKLRSKAEIERQLKTYVYPRWGQRPFTGITRRDVAELLDRIEDENGPVQADRVLATVRKLFGWYQTRDDDFISPVVAGMGRTRPAERKRSRVLTDDEIRALWPHLERGFGNLVKMLLLTGQRRAKVAAMRWQDIDANGLWTIPSEPREKNNPGSLKLSRMALDVIGAQPKIKSCDYVFPARTRKPLGWGPMAGFSPFTRELDKAVPLPHWQLHDLRRTAKTLMARAGVRPDISERALGHVIAGVEGVYDQHDYGEEKGDALERLAGLVELILNPPEDNVVELGATQ